MMDKCYAGWPLSCTQGRNYTRFGVGTPPAQRVSNEQSTLSCSGASQNYFEHMKRIFLTLTFVGILATSLAGFAQTNTPATDGAAPAATPAPATDAAPASTAPADAPAVEPPAAIANNDAAQPAAPGSA